MKALQLFFILFSFSSFAQVKTTQLTKATLPKTITYTGKIVNAVKYNDSFGETIVITTETGESQSKTEPDESYREAELFAYQYILTDGKWILQWKMYDYVKECPVDIECNFIKNSFAVTDLDKNGKAEVWLMYTTGCHGDVSASNMKVIVYEGTQKYAMRGHTKVRVSETGYDGGEHTFDEPFKKAPDAFRKYALKLWQKNLMQKFE
jgi:hypothetical protein